jgi:hypothetical protein
MALASFGTSGRAASPWRRTLGFFASLAVRLRAADSIFQYAWSKRGGPRKGAPVSFFQLSRPAAVTVRCLRSMLALQASRWNPVSGARLAVPQPRAPVWQIRDWQEIHASRPASSCRRCRLDAVHVEASRYAGLDSTDAWKARSFNVSVNCRISPICSSNARHCAAGRGLLK